MNEIDTKTQEKDFIQISLEKLGVFWSALMNFGRKTDSHPEITAEMLKSYTQYGTKSYTQEDYTNEIKQKISTEIDNIINKNRGESATKQRGFAIPIVDREYTSSSIPEIIKWLEERGFTCEYRDRSCFHHWYGVNYIHISW